MKMMTVFQIAALVSFAVFGAYQSAGEAEAQSPACVENSDSCLR